MLVAAAGTFFVAALGLQDWRAGDWGAESKPAVDALLHGHLQSFLALAPAYGGSLVLRAPFILMSKLWGGGELAVFRAAAAPCLAALAILGVWLFAHLRALGRPALVRWAALLLCVANPVSISALRFGHAEELLASALAIGAVLAATRGRWAWAAVLLGLAVATKDWALLAVGPVVLALPERRVQSLLLAGAVTAAVLAPLEFGSGGSFGSATAGAVRAPAVFSPFQVWWFLGHVEGAGGHRAPIGWVSAIAHPLIVALTVPLTLLCMLRRRRVAWRPPQEALLLLVLLLLLRCALDPWDNSYYPVSFVLALAVWETLSFARLPVLAIAGVLAIRLADGPTAGRAVPLTPRRAGRVLPRARAWRADGSGRHALLSAPERIETALRRPPGHADNLIVPAAFAAIGGLIVGSFLNVVAYRLPRGESLLWPASHCPSCGVPVKPRDNLPVLGWLLLHGRCRACKQPISGRYPIVEAGSAALAVLVLVTKHSAHDIVLGLLLVAVLVPVALDRPRQPHHPQQDHAARRARGADRRGGDTTVGSPGAADCGRRGWGLPAYFRARVPTRNGDGGRQARRGAGAVPRALGRSRDPDSSTLLGAVVGVAVMARVGVGAGRKTAVPFGPFLALGGLIALFVGPAITHWYLHSVL